MTTLDVTTEVLQQIRTDIRELRTSLETRIDGLDARIDGLDARIGVLAYAMRGMATDVHAITRLLRQVAEEVADHGTRIDQLESDR